MIDIHKLLCIRTAVHHKFGHYKIGYIDISLSRSFNIKKIILLNDLKIVFVQIRKIDTGIFFRERFYDIIVKLDLL